MWCVQGRDVFSEGWGPRVAEGDLEVNVGEGFAEADHEDELRGVVMLNGSESKWVGGDIMCSRWGLLLAVSLHIPAENTGEEIIPFSKTRAGPQSKHSK